jgi:allophanate hydrolase subunit 1
MRADAEVVSSGKTFRIALSHGSVDELIQTITRAGKHNHAVDIGLPCRYGGVSVDRSILERDIHMRGAKLVGPDARIPIPITIWSHQNLTSQHAEQAYRLFVLCSSAGDATMAPGFDGPLPSDH